MMNRFSFSYCLLQYEHNPWLQERLNIGVFVFCRAKNAARLLVRSWDGRITAAYPTLNKSNFTEDLKQIERNILRRSKNGFAQLSFLRDDLACEFDKKNANHAHLFAKICAPDADSSYRWAAGGVGLISTAQSIDAKAEELYHRFVVPYEKPKPSANRSDDQVWYNINKMLLERNLADHIEAEPVVYTDLGKLKFQAGYRNGKMHLIQPLSFDLSNADHIAAKAGKWGGYAQAIKSSSTGHAAHFVLGKPLEEELMEPYEQACRFLSKIVGSEMVIEEDHGGRLVDRIEYDIASH